MCLNIKSIRNRLGDVDNIVDGNVDILYIVETKLDEHFPNNQFVLMGFHLPYRLNITDKKGGLIVFVKSHIQEGLIILKFHLIYKLYLLK